MSPKLVVGLGNPGKKYANSRHNAGFMAVDFYAQKNGAVFGPSSFNGELAKLDKGGTTLLLVKPTTFMNDSGRCVSAVINFYHIRLEDVLILYDDMDIDLGQVRIRADGSSGGQRGMQSVISALGTSELQRIRIGIGRPMRTAGEYVVDHVLDNFTAFEKKVLADSLKVSSLAIDDFLSKPFESVMNAHNKKRGGQAG